MGDLSNKMSGKGKEMAGKVTGDKKLELKGKAQHDIANMKMKAKDTYHDMVDDIGN